MDSLKWIHLIFLISFSISICIDSNAQEKHYVFFYNVENLFDPYNDPHTDDDDYTSSGANHWNKERFNLKIQMIAKTILAGCNGNFPDIIGLAEIENRWVLDQLISKTPLSEIPYQIVHKDSPDARGIDVALIFRKDRIIPLDFDFLKISKTGKNGFLSRDILYFEGKIEGTTIQFFVNHWPSRSEGYLESKEKRAIAARVLKLKTDSLFKAEGNPNILIMGDFNSGPKEESLLKILQASINGKHYKYPLLNLSTEWFSSNKGTIYRAGVWEILDQFICSGNLIGKDGLKIQPNSTKICLLPYLMEMDQKYLKWKPFRTYLGTAYHGGVSDHLPIVTIIQKY